MEEVAYFNRPSAQTVQQIELHARREVLDHAVPIFRKSLPPGVEFRSVETISPSFIQRFGWN